MKIVNATDNYWPRFSGIAVSIDSFKKGLENLGHEVYVFAPGYPNNEEGDEERKSKNIYRFTSLGAFVTKEDRLTSPFAKNQIFSTLDTIKPDIIHIQTEFTMGRIVRKYALDNNIPLVITSHTYWEKYINQYVPFLPDWLVKLYIRKGLKRLLAPADLVFTPTEQMRILLQTYGINRSIEILPTGIDKDHFNDVEKNKDKERSDLIQKHPELKDKRILLYAGRIALEKNVAFLTDVIERLAPDFPDIVLLVVGDGPYKNKMQKIARRKGLEGFFVFPGYIEREKMKYIFSISDIFVFPSKSESQGLVTIESMLCGTPVVAIGEMGTIAIMNGNNGGYMVNDDTDEFTQAVTKLLSDPELYQQKAREAITHSQKWISNTFIQQLNEKYMKLIQ